MKNVKSDVKNVLELLREVELYEHYKDNLVKSVNTIFAEYQEGKHSYFEYKKRLAQILKGKSKKEWLEYYNSYIYSLLKKIELINAKIFYETYKDKEYLERISEISARETGRRISTKEIISEAKASKSHERKKWFSWLRRSHIKLTPPPKEKINKPVSAIPVGINLHLEKIKTEPPRIKIEPKDYHIKLKEIHVPKFKRPSVFARAFGGLREAVKRIFRKKKKEEKIKISEARPAPARIEAAKFEAAPKIEILPKVEPSPKIESLQRAEKPAPKPKREFVITSFFRILFGRTTKKPRAPRPAIPAERERKRFVSTGEYIIGLVKKFFGVRESTYVSEKTEIPKSAMELKRKKIVPTVPTGAPPTAIAEEAARIRRLIEARAMSKIYRPSFLGSLANILVKKLSLFLIDTFPEFFKYLYNALRLANIPMLSNTYVNIMTFVSLLVSTISFVFFIFLFSVLGNPLAMIIVKSLLLSILTTTVSFFGFYGYPFGKIKQRRKNIRTNLPFAINHMAAVAASGVPPTKMFELIAESEEYGEISVEINKVVDYINIFGYDFVTALKTVAGATPSPTFKEFIDGMVSTIESGGDLKIYMGEKSDEAMTEYELERSKYEETLSTYSDIYTGILIAAPLFFIAALSLISLLGGEVAGIPVDTLIATGTYIVIPVLNVVFLMFLQLTQPEV
jgi:flagellar protein FlaJ